MPRIYEGYASVAANADLDNLLVAVAGAANVAARGEVDSAKLGNADAVLTANVDKSSLFALVALTAGRNITLADVTAASEGSYFLISRTSAGAFDYTVKRASGVTVVQVSQNEWALVMVDETGVWQLMAFGTLT